MTATQQGSGNVDRGPDKARKAVERGAAWLDNKCPDWLGHIDLAWLELQSPHRCMLAQTSECLAPNAQPDERGRYFMVLKRLGFSPWGPWAAKHGFNISQTDKPPYDYEMLQIAWETLIKDRLVERARAKAQ